MLKVFAMAEEVARSCDQSWPQNSSSAQDDPVSPSSSSKVAPKTRVQVEGMRVQVSLPCKFRYAQSEKGMCVHTENGAGGSHSHAIKGAQHNTAKA